MRQPVNAIRPRVATALCRAVGLCLIAAALLNTESTFPYLRGLVPVSVVGPHFLAIVLTWALMLAGGLGLLARQPWAFVGVYVACGVNVLPAFCFLPFVDGLLKAAIGVQAASHVVVYGFNPCVVAVLVWSQLRLDGGHKTLRQDA